MGNNVSEMIPQYVRRIQQPQMCFTAMKQMILERRNPYERISQESLARESGVYIDERDVYMFMNMKDRARKKDDPEVGMRITNLEGKNPSVKDNRGLETELFRPSRISGVERFNAFIAELEETLGKHKNYRKHPMYHQNFLKQIRNSEFFKKDHLPAVEEFLVYNIEHGYDTAVNHHWRVFRDTDNGHYTLAAAFDHRNKDLMVGDPAPFSPEFWKFDLGTFLISMFPFWDKNKKDRIERGFIKVGPPYRDMRRKNENKVNITQVPRYVPIVVIPHRIVTPQTKNSKLRVSENP